MELETIQVQRYDNKHTDNYGLTNASIVERISYGIGINVCNKHICNISKIAEITPIKLIAFRDGEIVDAREDSEIWLLFSMMSYVDSTWYLISNGKEVQIVDQNKDHGDLQARLKECKIQFTKLDWDLIRLAIAESLK